MGQYHKGIDTKNAILETAKTLFYQNGYENTTVRQIASESQTNLGLIKYYFNSKVEIALQIYLSVRDACAEWISEVTSLDQRILHLISSASELMICFNNPAFCQFYHEIYKEFEVTSYFQQKIYTVTEGDLSKEYMTLASASISAIKPTLINQYIHDTDKTIKPEFYIRFYMEQQVHFHHLGNVSELCDTAMKELDKLYFNVAPGFIPVMQKVK